MKVFQVLVLADKESVDMESALYDLSMPNPLFLSLEGAKKWVLGEVNALRADYQLWPILFDAHLYVEHRDETGSPLWAFLELIEENSGVSYRIVETEVHP